MNLNDSWGGKWEIQMGSWEFATKPELPRCDGKARDGMYACKTYMIYYCVFTFGI